MKQVMECDKCHKVTTKDQLYRLSWRWNDKERRYKSGFYIIHTGYKHLCKKCLKLFTD